MVFQSKQQIVCKCFKKYKKICLLTNIAYILFAIFAILVVAHHSQSSLGLFIYIIIGLFFFMLMIRTTKRGFFLLNKIIDSIEIIDRQIAFKTFSSSFYLDLFFYDSIEINVNSDLIQFELSGLTYGFDTKKHYTKNIYLLVYAGDEYMLAEGFFDDFDKLKSLLGILT